MDQQSATSIIHFPAVTIANTTWLRLARSLEFLGNVFTVAILSSGDFRTSESLAFHKAAVSCSVQEQAYS